MFDLGERRALAHERRGLRAGPAERVDAGIDHEPPRRATFARAAICGLTVPRSSRK